MARKPSKFVRLRSQRDRERHLLTEVRERMPDGETLVIPVTSNSGAVFGSSLGVSAILSTRTSANVSLDSVPPMPEKQPMPKPKPNPRPKEFPTDQGWVFEGYRGGYQTPLVMKDLHCCGVKELHGIQRDLFFVKPSPDPDDESSYGYSPQTCEEMVHEAKKLMRLAGRHRPVWIFTEAHYGTDRPATRLAEYIRQHNLGMVMETPVAKNYNSGNNIIAFMWMPPVDFGFQKDQWHDAPRT